MPRRAAVQKSKLDRVQALPWVAIRVISDGADETAESAAILAFLATEGSALLRDVVVDLVAELAR